MVNTDALQLLSDLKVDAGKYAGEKEPFDLIMRRAELAIRTAFGVEHAHYQALERIRKTGFIGFVSEENYRNHRRSRIKEVVNLLSTAIEEVELHKASTARRARGTALVCEDGHVLSRHIESEGTHNTPFCPECGRKTLRACPKCEARILGDDPLLPSAESKRPACCTSCGDPFPWTEKLLSQAEEVAELAEGLTDKERGLLKSSLEDIIRGSPSASFSAKKVKMLAVKGGEWTASLVRDILVQVGSSAAAAAMSGG